MITKPSRFFVIIYEILKQGGVLIYYMFVKIKYSAYRR